MKKKGGERKVVSFERLCFFFAWLFQKSCNGKNNQNAKEEANKS